MSTVTDVNYNTIFVAPTPSDSIREAHSYEYDNNGNIVYVNTSRLKPDMTAQPDTVQKTREERFRWDEDNRLTALSQNGYVSHYWYDADGERTVKMHGGSMAVFVKSKRDGRSLDSQQTTAYFSPYFTIHEGQFTKHLYIGSERVASMTGDLSPGDVSNSPAGGYNISHAGYDVGVTQLNIPYAYKRAAMIDSAEANYAYFDLPNALEGQSRQTSEYVLPAEDSEEMGNGGSVGCSTGPRGEVSYNGNIWFIHTDHLGSSTLITDGNGQLVQQIEYLPYGEVFLEKQASGSTYATPYKFNGKELDEETGLYYYGARYMNPRLSIWYATDPLEEKYPSANSYGYCLGNPICLLDIDGFEPGDPFTSMDAAAIDFAMLFNPKSIKLNKEFGATNYSYRNKEGKTRYTYTKPIKGTEHHVSTGLAPCGTNTEAEIHTHGHDNGTPFDNVFSGSTKNGGKTPKTPRENMTTRDRYDIAGYNESGYIGYLASPNGKLQKYDPKSGRITIVKSDIPRDHVVKKGESLVSIAKQYSITAKKIIIDNEIKKNIKVGDHLIIQIK